MLRGSDGELVRLVVVDQIAPLEDDVRRECHQFRRITAVSFVVAGTPANVEA